MSIDGWIRAAAVAALLWSPLPVAATVSAEAAATVRTLLQVAGEDCTIVGTEGPDTLAAPSPRPEVICGLGGDDLISGGSGDDVFVGGSGADTVTYERSPSAIRADLAAGTAEGQGSDRLEGIENLFGSSASDSLSGDAGPNDLRGGYGEDVLAGREGDDFVSGGGDSDILEGGAGRDVASWEWSRTGVVASLKRDLATGQGTDRLTGFEDLTGSPQRDVLSGSNWPNVLKGLAGSDLLRGDWGADTLRGGEGPDSLQGAGGDDVLDGGRGTDGCLQAEGTGSKRRCEASAYGQYEGVALFQPSWQLVGIGFHESLFASAATVRPHGRLVLNDSRSKFTPPPQTDGVPYVVMASRGRPTPATSAVDVVVGSRTTAVSPVNGTVIAVRYYLLYCDRPDWQVLIRPDGDPSLVVMVLHIEGIQVARGDRVVASQTALGVSWTNDSSGAQENDYFPDQYPHVHVEVERNGATPVPGCLP